MIVFDVLLYALLLVLLWFMFIIFLLLLLYGSDFKRFWLEPMLAFPVVIFESDDWGVGPREQVAALAELLQLLSKYQDKKKHFPVMTLGMVLAEPDFEQIKLNDKRYFRRDLSDERYHELVQLIKDGQQQQIFSIHLHGMEHYWPDSLMKALASDELQQWFFQSQSVNRITENLPSFLQSRWCDSSTLPSVPLNGQDIEKAIKMEVSCFRKVFDQGPVVVVPPTFVWTDEVIKHYALKQVKLFITPGKQFIGRDVEGVLVANNKTILNGDSESGSETLYLVRDVYFEPERGHKAESVLIDIVERTCCGRPSLIEMHRSNFLTDKQHSIGELKNLLDSINEQLAETLFLSAEELSLAFQSGELLIQSFYKCFFVWLKRIQLFLKYKRIAKYSGLNQILDFMI